MEIAGWAGVIVYVVAYGCLSAGLLKADRVLYHLLNAAGGLLLVVFSWHINDRPNFYVNVIWMVIAIVSVFRTARRKQGQQ